MYKGTADPCKISPLGALPRFSTKQMLLSLMVKHRSYKARIVGSVPTGATIYPKLI